MLHCHDDDDDDDDDDNIRHASAFKECTPRLLYGLGQEFITDDGVRLGRAGGVCASGYNKPDAIRWYVATGGGGRTWIRQGGSRVRWWCAEEKEKARRQRHQRQWQRQRQRQQKRQR
jgi:hypothetical protein